MVSIHPPIQVFMKVANLVLDRVGLPLVAGGRLLLTVAILYNIVISVTHKGGRVGADIDSPSILLASMRLFHIVDNPFLIGVGVLFVSCPKWDRIVAVILLLYCLLSRL